MIWNRKKNFENFLEVTVTWSNEQMVTLLEVMITSQVTITSQEVIVTSPINEQMVEAINSWNLLLDRPVNFKLVQNLVSITVHEVAVRVRF